MDPLRSTRGTQASSPRLLLPALAIAGLLFCLGCEAGGGTGVDAVGGTDVVGVDVSKADTALHSGVTVFAAEVGIWYPGTLCPFDCFVESQVQGQMSRHVEVAEDAAVLWELLTQEKPEQVTLTFVGDAQWPKDLLGIPLTFQRQPSDPTIWRGSLWQIVVDEAAARMRVQFVQPWPKLCGATYSATFTP